MRQGCTSLIQGVAFDLDQQVVSRWDRAAKVVDGSVAPGGTGVGRRDRGGPQALFNVPRCVGGASTHREGEDGDEEAHDD